MAYGYIVESQLMADDIGTLNKTATSATNVDGGNLVTLAYSNGAYTATLGTAGANLGFYMAYNPTEHLTTVGTGTSQKLFAGLSADPRDYTNIATRPIDVFKPQVGDTIVFTAANITGTAPTAEQYLEPAANGVLTMKASQTASSTSFKVLEVTTIPFPNSTKGVGMEFAAAYKCECVAN